MPEGVTFKSITAGSTYTCALTAAGSVGGEGKAYCWGDGSSGQTGQGYEVSCSLTVQSRAGTSSCSVVQSQTGKVTPNLPPSPTPRSGPLWKPAPVDGNRTYIDIAAGGSHTCGIESTGDVYCWGADDYGSLGDNDDSHPGGSVFSPLAVDTPAGKSFSRITGGTGYSCALTSSSSAGGAGQAYCWGRGSNGALGNGEEENYDLAVQVILPSGVRFAQISGGSSHVCALSLEGAAYCWGKGDDNDGRLGLNDEDNAENRLTPAPVVMPAGVTFSAIAAADDFTCALQSEVGNLYCWGYAYMYGLANGDNQVNRFVPYPAVMPTF